MSVLRAEERMVSAPPPPAWTRNRGCGGQVGGPGQDEKIMGYGHISLDEALYCAKVTTIPGGEDAVPFPPPAKKWKSILRRRGPPHR